MRSLHHQVGDVCRISSSGWYWCLAENLDGVRGVCKDGWEGEIALGWSAVALPYYIHY